MENDINKVPKHGNIRAKRNDYLKERLTAYYLLDILSSIYRKEITIRVLM